MDISLKHENYKFLKAYKENGVEECVECEITLPEYMPEILRIIKTVAYVQVNSCKVIESKVNVEGVCNIKMIYTGEDNCIYSFDVSKPFFCTHENNEFEEAVDICVKPKVSYTNCKAVSTKRVEIKIGVGIEFVAYFSCDEDVISTSDEMNIEEKRVSIDALSLGCKKTRSFSLNDTITFEKTGCFIIGVVPCAILTQVRKINNKIMIKGDAIAEICYVSAEDKSRTEIIRHNIPINQIMEFEGLEEHMTGDVALKVTAADVVVKGESGSAFTSADIALGIDASISMWEEKQMQVITDAYAIGSSIELEKEKYVFYKNAATLNENYIFESSFSVAGEGVKKVLGKEYVVSDVCVKAEDGILTLCGNLAASLLICDNGNSISVINKNFEFSFTHKNENYNKNCTLAPDVVVTALSCYVKGENTIDIRAEFRVCGTVLYEDTIEVVKDIKESDKPFNRNTCAITVYFPEKPNESLWSIARRYNTTVRAIAEENLLDGDTTDNLKMIFIPSA